MSRPQADRPAATFIIPFRQRSEHLRALSHWLMCELTLMSSDNPANHVEVIVIEADTRPSIECEHDFPKEWKYHFVETSGVFHKTKLLNIALSMSSGEMVMPYDVDLVPARHGVISTHVQLALRAKNFGLITGYRLMSDRLSIGKESDMTVIAGDASIAPEDQATALSKHLRGKGNFGVLPLFCREKLRAFGGWDERFVGWGGEDEELISRYLTQGHHLLRCPELLYIHQHHEKESFWAELEYTSKNRAYFAELQGGRIAPCKTT